MRVATTADTSFVLDLQKRFTNQLGFLPFAAIDWLIEHRRCRLVFENGQPAGYVLGRERLSTSPHVAPIFQTAIDFSAQRRKLGLQLVEAAAFDAFDNRCTILQAWCRVDLEANHFWQAAGFESIAIRHPPTVRGLPLILWRRSLTANGSLQMLQLPRRAGHQAKRHERRRLLTAKDRSTHLDGERDAA